MNTKIPLRIARMRGDEIGAMLISLAFLTAGIIAGVATTFFGGPKPPNTPHSQ